MTSVLGSRSVSLSRLRKGARPKGREPIGLFAPHEAAHRFFSASAKET